MFRYGNPVAGGRLAIFCFFFFEGTSCSRRSTHHLVYVKLSNSTTGSAAKWAVGPASDATEL